MHPLRFPNNGIKAKVAGQGQAPCRGEQPWPGYLQGAIGYGQAPCKGAATRRGCSSQGATTHGHGRLRPARRGG
ncbi:hypothetical protein B296_00017156, partial [Ensete ventricosum]